MIKNRYEFKRLYRDSRNKYGKPWENKTADEIISRILKEWAIESYGEHVQSCVDEVIRVDQNDSLYRWKLMQPIVPGNTFENSHYDGSVVSRSMIDALKFYKSPLFD